MDFLTLKEIQYLVAKLSNMISILRKAEAVGAISTTSSAYASVPRGAAGMLNLGNLNLYNEETVSYTHLTLPTNREV